jgi:cysteine synthase A
MSKICGSITELVGHTPLVELTNFEKKHDLNARLIGKLEYLNPTGSVKDRAALAMIEKGEREGKLKPGGTIVDSTSGNTGISLVAFGAAKGYKCHIFMEPGCTPERTQILKAYGATVQSYTDIPGFREIVATKGFDTEAICAAIQKFADDNGYYYTSQLYNDANPDAHIQTTGPEIVEDTDGKVDYAVMLAGTSGTLTGVGQYLQQHVPGVKIVAVQPTLDSVYSATEPARTIIDGVVNFDGPGRHKQPFMIRRDFEYDECIDVTSQEAFATARELAETDGLFLGTSAAAAVYAAKSIAERPGNEGKNIIIILPDDGMKYLSTEMFRK